MKKSLILPFLEVVKLLLSLLSLLLFHFIFFYFLNFFAAFVNNIAYDTRRIKMRSIQQGIGMYHLDSRYKIFTVETYVLRSNPCFLKLRTVRGA